MKWLFAVLTAATAYGQLQGVIDIHAHCAPDSTPRSIDAIALARLAKSRGMRGLVLKNHYEATASLAYIVRQAVPGIELYGGIDLNRSVGGLNTAAVERMAMDTGGYGRVIWMPTYDSENQVRYSKQDRPFVSVSRNGELLPEAKEIIALAAKHHLMLETGHSSALEGLMIVREAKKQGVEHIVVTHGMLSPVQMTIPQMREAAALGAYIEFVYGAIAGVNKELELSDYMKAIREVGAKSCILSSDMGQPGNPLHPDALIAFFAALRKAGFTQSEIDLMSKTNPATALGLR